MEKRSGQVAIVTGGSQGIGLATVRRLQSAETTVHIFDLGPGPDPSYTEAIAAGAVLPRPPCAAR